MIVVDASVLIAHLDESDVLHARAEAALLERADESLGCSPMTLAEVLTGPIRRGQLAAARRALADLELEEVALGEDAAVQLATIRAQTGLKMPDCCVLLAAQRTAARVLSFDDELARHAAPS